jgi:spermidine synthase
MSKTNATGEPQPISHGLRRFLYATAGLTGAAILIVEILGAKMLSPFVGTSHFVWTAQIAVTLVSLAVGYYFGGKLVDRSPRLERLFFCIALAAAYLCFGILIIEKVAYLFLNLNLALGALLSSAVLFFVPLTLLAAVGPFLIKVLALSFQGIGGQVGRLNAISTLGSVLGTIIIGYLLLPFLPNSVTMYLTAAILLLDAAIYFVFWKRKSLVPLAIIAAIAFLLGAFGIRSDLVSRWAYVEELYRGNSNFGMLQVIQSKDQRKRYYLNDYLVQNTYDPQLKKSTSLFTYMLRYLAEGYSTNCHDVLCIGLGVGIVPRDLAHEGKRVDVVEINPKVVELGQKYFDLDPTLMDITIGDGRYFVNRTTNRYDAIVLDAFLGDSSPSHLMTREAFENMRRIMRPNGVLVINSFGDFAPDRDYFMGSLSKTLRAVFPSIETHATGNGNVFWVASLNPAMKLHPVSIADAHPDVKLLVESCLSSIVHADPNSGRVLTDDFNPVEFYDAVNREIHRRSLAFSVRKL